MSTSAESVLIVCVIFAGWVLPSGTFGAVTTWRWLHRANEKQAPWKDTNQKGTTK